MPILQSGSLDPRQHRCPARRGRLRGNHELDLRETEDGLPRTFCVHCGVDTVELDIKIRRKAHWRWDKAGAKPDWMTGRKPA